MIQLLVKSFLVQYKVGLSGANPTQQKGKTIQLLKIFHIIYAGCRMAWTKTMRLKPEESCVDCHFFMRRNGQCPGNLEEIKEPERKSLRQGGNPWAARNCELSCSFGVWDEGLDFFDFLEVNRYQVIVETNRRGFCFWWPYHPGMLLPAAKILQEREAKNRDAARDRRLTLYGLWIAAIALVANVVLKLVELFCQFVGWIKRKRIHHFNIISLPQPF